MLFGRHRIPVFVFGCEVAFEHLPEVGEEEALFFELGFDEWEQGLEVRVGFPEVVDLGVPEAVDRGVGQNFECGIRSDFEAGGSGCEFEEGDASGEDIGGFGGWRAALDVRGVDYEFGVFGGGGVDVFFGFGLMSGSEEGAEVDEFDSALGEAHDVVGFEVDDHDAVSVEPSHDVERLEDRAFEVEFPIAFITIGGGVVAPGLEILAVEELHENEGEFAGVIDIGTVERGEEGAEVVEVLDIFEVGEFEGEAHVGAVGDLVGLGAIEVKDLGDDSWAGGSVDGGFWTLFERSGEPEFAQAWEVERQVFEPFVGGRSESGGGGGVEGWHGGSLEWLEIADARSGAGG